MNKDKILITGSTGFIGKELLKSLKHRKVYILSRKKVKKKYNKHINIRCDLRKKNNIKSILTKISPTIIYHLAWYGIPTFDRKNFQINKEITDNLIECINKSTCKKIIISGSCAEYGNTMSCVKESSKTAKEISSLGKQKNYIRNLFFKKLDKKIICIWSRIFYVYGLGQRKGSLLSSISSCKEKFFQLKSPNTYNDYIYIKDVINALIIVKNFNKSLIVNICTGRSLSNLYFATVFAKLNDIKIFTKKSKITTKKKLFYGSNKLLKKIGWRQRFNLKNSFKDILS